MLTSLLVAILERFVWQIFQVEPYQSVLGFKALTEKSEPRNESGSTCEQSLQTLFGHRLQTLRWNRFFPSMQLFMIKVFR